MSKATTASGGLRFLVWVMAFTFLLWVSAVLKPRPSHGQWPLLNHHKVENDAVEASSLLPPGSDERSCLSRYESLLYRRGPPRKPSPHLVSKLRSYEARHKKCGPHSHSYNQTLRHLESGGGGSASAAAADCKYVVWIAFEGLGNKMLTLASAFLYALLTDRVLLADRGVDMPDLFCEPFPEASFFVPSDFPISRLFTSFNQKSNQSYRNFLNTNSTLQVQPYIYLHLVHDYDDQDKLFFCDEYQNNLQNIPWLIMKSDVYFVPSLFLMPSFQQELDLLFPVKETVFHFLGRYLFHPTNSVWGLITRFHHAYLSNADVRVGIQVRVFESEGGRLLKHVLDQILSCTMKEKILPQIRQHEKNQSSPPPEKKKTTVAVVMTSLNSGYFESIRDMYWENPTETGEVVGVFQPSHEEYQQSEKRSHNRKAWAEIYLLSLSDKLVTSGWSTFGYVAQGLGGLKPWIMYRPENKTTPEPACGRAVSMEPCFLAPPFYDCRLRRGADTGAIVPHVRHCEDVSWGLKLVDIHG